LPDSGSNPAESNVATGNSLPLHEDTLSDMRFEELSSIPWSWHVLAETRACGMKWQFPAAQSGAHIGTTRIASAAMAAKTVVARFRISGIQTNCIIQLLRYAASTEPSTFDRSDVVQRVPWMIMLFPSLSIPVAFCPARPLQFDW